jgi:hypothetical protein
MRIAALAQESCPFWNSTTSRVESSGFACLPRNNASHFIYLSQFSREVIFKIRGIFME